MNAADSLYLFLVMAALALLPSASVGLVISRSVSDGFRHGAAAAMGVVAGDLVFVTAALLGMTALSAALGGVFTLVRICAGVFLVYYGVQLWRQAATPATAHRRVAAPRGSGRWKLAASFAAGWGLTLADIKAIIFYASLLPLFVELSPLDPKDGAIVITVTVLSVGGAKLFYAGLASRLSQRKIARGSATVARKSIAVGVMTAGGFLIVRPH